MKDLSLVFILTCFISNLSFAQSKNSMTPDVYSEWNKIRNVKLSDDGNWAMYHISREIGDKELKIYDTRKDRTYSFQRVIKSVFDQNGKYAYFTVGHSYVGTRELERKKTKKDKMPKDTLCIYNLENKVVTKIPNVKSFSTPTDYGGYLAFLMEPDAEQDTIKTPVKESRETGSKLIFVQPGNSKYDTLYYAKDYSFAKKERGFVATSLGAEEVIEKGVYSFDFARSNFAPILESKADISHLSWSEDAQQLSFIADADTTENEVRPYELYYWDSKSKLASMIADQSSDFLPEGHMISNFTAPKFSRDGSRLIFRIAPPAILQDTALLKDEIVNVEVWHYDEDVLYTRQENSLSTDKKKDFECIYDIDSKSFMRLGDEAYDRIYFDEGYNSSYAIARHMASYNKERMWLGYGKFDGYRIDLENGEKVKFTTGSRGWMMRSPNGKYCMWYDASIRGYWAYDVDKNTVHQIATKALSQFGDELNDRPMDPSSYGYYGFSDDDQFVLIYDRYDVWVIDPSNTIKPRKITDGRKDRKIHRIVRLDTEEKTTDLLKPLLLHVFNEVDKSESYVTLDIKSGVGTELYKGDVKLDKTPIKARSSEDCITTIEDYHTFPDLVLTQTDFKKMHTFTNVNPQKKDYLWGEIKLHSWVSDTGEKLDGLLVFPEGFDPDKKYPLIVNFYERSSNGLHNHRAPYAHRSTINYSYYSSKGYIIFNPDVVYRVGYPGQSCYESVIPGVKSLVELGFIDEERIGVQGHSWGGYQIADLLTKTDIFACAEAGAPVVNMISAYGGIRWGSGMSRMFQYEKTQSRLGATLWERPDLYIENSPIFKLDKVTTPVLILHNDEDGAVPWYQGIEYFNAMRRLEKPAWFLNYNKEPHWPVKWQNRLDFNIRMEQFFDHFLQDKPMPRWMKEGVPAIQKGIDQGLDHKE